jgi:hypothetical protein
MPSNPMIRWPRLSVGEIWFWKLVIFSTQFDYGKAGLRDLGKPEGYKEENNPIAAIEVKDEKNQTKAFYNLGGIKFFVFGTLLFCYHWFFDFL